MNGEENIANEILEKTDEYLKEGRHWLAYDTDIFPLTADRLYFFRSKASAILFVAELLEETGFRIFYASTVEAALKQLPLDFTNKSFLSLSKHTTMNQENLEYLIDSLKNLGFGDKLNQELEKNIAAGTADINLKTEALFNGQKMETTLSFRKGEKNEMYFLNRYHAAIIKNDGPDPSRSQTFYINRGSGVTCKEAFNLLEGRAINKNLFDAGGNKYNAWMQLDFQNRDKYNNYETKQYHQNYGYDIEKVLDKYPIKELGDAEERKMLIGSLRRGNLQQVSFEKDGEKEKMFIEANPKFKTLNVYDQQKKLVINEAQKQNVAKEKNVTKEENKENKKENKRDSKSRSKTDEAEPDTKSKSKTLR